MGFFGVSVELHADYRGKEFKIKFLETADIVRPRP